MSRKIYSEVRSIIVNELQRDLYGPNYDEIDILKETPSQAYLTGILYPQDSENIEEEELADVHLIEKNDNENLDNYDDEEIEKENINTNLVTNKRQNSLGIKCYVSNKLDKIKAMVRWGEYEKSTKYDDEKKKNIPIWTRKIISHPIDIDLKQDYFKKELSNKIFLIANKIRVKNTNNYLFSVFILNKNVDKTNMKSIYQVSLKLSDFENRRIFISENTVRHDQTDFQEFLYRNKPIFAKGFGCAVDWSDYNSQCAGILKTAFIPTHEIEGMSTELAVDPNLTELPSNYFSIRQFATESNKGNVIKKLMNLADRYERWIERLPINLVEDKNSALEAINKCKFSLTRIKEGIEILLNNENAFKAFKFMNEVMHTQASMKNFSKDNLKTTLLEELEKENFAWRPFQLAFILLNIKGIVSAETKDREIVDLLWFPTGGGKTEAYLGIISFLLGYRRLTNDITSEYEKDGGVTVILRYTLRLLTTQQRDRLMRLIAAAEYIRVTNPRLYGSSEFSIGFWVGGNVTANKFDDLKVSNYNEVWQVENEYRKIKKQVIECPCCGTKEPDYRILPNSNPSTSKTGVEIRCKNKSCYFSEHHIPVYLIDEEIYRKTPSIIISTVDKFARLPWDEKTATLFGKVNRFCEKCGYIAEGEPHPNFHRNPNAKVKSIKPFYPPELIIQDELHLITGPLGTVYGLYETAIEKLATATVNGKEILPKYVAATATIRNAEEQVKKVFGRLKSNQFPPAGLDVNDSFFGREVPLEEFPFRLYTGICVSGHSMKTVILRVYAVLLQVSETLITDEKYKKFAKYVDPYRTLIGYFNSVRELGGAVRLLDDDVRKRIQTIKKKYGYSKERYINRNEELTSRVPSYRIPKVLELLEKSLGDNELDVVLATNMISVGMDVDRLGLMVVNGQPKQTSEYIQASSRVGRSKPGLVITVYNPYRPRDLSHYENFKGYHSRLYHFVEGTTATPFAARARDRALHALLVSVLRLTDINLATNENAANISIADISELKQFIINRVSISDMKNKFDTERDIHKILDKWIEVATKNSELKYYFYPSKKQLEKEEVRLLSRFNDITPKNKDEFDTLDSMRQIESTSKIFIKDGWNNL
jgi:superfamily II DNA/RNA helicase